MLKQQVQDRLRALGIRVTIVAKNIGYELRCADPIPFDMEYTRDLGYCAAKYICEGGTAAMVSIQEGRFKPVPFFEIMDPQTGRTKVRMVDVNSDRYKIAASYMLRLRREDFDDPKLLERHAATAHMTPDEFRAQFEYLVKGQAPSSLRPQSR
jgi:6-phosphofructokinase 1